MVEVFIYDALRTPRGKGKPSGSLYEVKPIKLLATVLKQLQQRHQLDTSLIDDTLIGCVTPIGDQGGNIAKSAVLYADWSMSVPAMQLNRLCASGLDAINLAAMKISSGWEKLIVAGGVESMSRVPMASDGGANIFDPEVSVHIGYIPQGVAADLIATIHGISREDADNFAIQSNQRAASAQEKGYFTKSIVPIYDDNGLVILDNDELIHPDTTPEKLANLPLSFQQIGEMGYETFALQRYPFVEKINYIHTAGTSSALADGAAALLIGDKRIGKQLTLKPRARIRAVATTASEPTLMLTGHIAATQKVLKVAGLTQNDIDLWEVNEAFAAPTIHFARFFNLDMEKVNVVGGAIALGHPLGATGAILMGTLLDELERRQLKRGLVTLCVGSGMGVATIVEIV
jgi:acetyl-CoA C-acetyltransferase